MAKAFTYSRLPEHQVAVYYEGSDKKGKRFSSASAAFSCFRTCKPFLLCFRTSIRVECGGMFVFCHIFFTSSCHVSYFSFCLRKGKLFLVTTASKSKRPLRWRVAEYSMKLKNPSCVFVNNRTAKKRRLSFKGHAVIWRPNAATFRLLE